MALFDSFYPTLSPSDFSLNPSDYSLGVGQLQGLGDVGSWNPYPGSYDMSLSLLQPPTPQPFNLSTDIGSLSLGGPGGMVNGYSLFYDTQTGQTVTPQQMWQIDAAEAQAALGTTMQAPGAPSTGSPRAISSSPNPMSDVSPGQNAPAGSTLEQLIKYIAYGGAGIGGVLGLAGALQTAQGKGDTTTSSTQRDVAPAGPNEQSVTDMLMRQIQQGQGPYNQLTSQIQQASDLQMQIMQALGPSATGLARGSVPMTPELQRTVETAFTPQLGSIAQQAIESARQRGFPGGAELLGQGPAGAIAGPALADLQGQIAAAKLQYATGLPMQAANILQAIGGNQAQAGNLQTNQFGSLLNLLNLQQNARLGAAGSNTSQMFQPGAPLMNAAQGFGNVLGGVGGALSGISKLNQPQYNVNFGALSGVRS